MPYIITKTIQQGGGEIICHNKYELANNILKNNISYSQLDKNIREDIELVKVLVTTSPSYYIKLPDFLKNNNEILQAAFNKHPTILRMATFFKQIERKLLEQLKASTKDMDNEKICQKYNPSYAEWYFSVMKILEAYKKGTLVEVPLDKRVTIDYVQQIVSISPMLYKELPSYFKDNDDILQTAFYKYPEILKEANAFQQNDKKLLIDLKSHYECVINQTHNKYNLQYLKWYQERMRTLDLYLESEHISSAITIKPYHKITKF